MLQYRKIWNEVRSQLFEKLTTEPIKGEGKYVHGKLKMWKEPVKTNFHGQDVPYMFCNATTVLKIDSVYKQGKNYHPEVYLEECKYTDAESQQCNMLRYDDDDGFLRCKNEGKKDFCNLLEGYKIIVNEQDVVVRKSKRVKYTHIPHRNCMKTKEEVEKGIKDTITKYKEIIFGTYIPICMTCMDELRKQQVIDKKAYDQKTTDDTVRKLAWDGLQKNIVMDGDTMIDMGTGQVLIPEVNFTCWKDKF